MADSDISNFTHKWRVVPAHSHQNDGNKVNKRNRQPVSCAPCRSRKLKCDRGHPCEQCSKRSDEDSCVYGKSTTAPATRRDDTKINLKAQERLRHLEELVKQMIEPEKGFPTPQSPPAEDSQPAEGSLSKDLNGTSYTGSTHWATMLDQIQELKNTLSPSNNPEDESAAHIETGNSYSIFSAPTPPPLQSILEKNLPSRDECNRYLSTYFNATYMTVPFIHKQQFKRQYERFWDAQLETSPIWVSVLFSVLCTADTIRRAPLSIYRNGLDTSNKSKSPFLLASAQCLVLGNFAKCQPHIVEALAMHSQCKYAATLDPSHELGLIFSILCRHAYTMGYHREPSVFEGQFTTFEGEMRRRCFSLLKQFDLMVSFQLGLPAIMSPDSADTRLPSHLLDDDFDEDTQVLPPPRPDTEPTQMLYLITKAGLMDIYSKVCQHTLGFPKQPFTAADIAKLDTSITQATESIPEGLRARPMSHSYADPPSITMTRSNLMFLCQKARCVLHRKYMVTGPSADESRQICITSSTKTITHFMDLHLELQPGGQLFNERWMLTSFTINDFLLALMVLCLAFSLGRKQFISKGGNADRWLEEDQDAKRIFEMLNNAQPVCAEYGAKAREARHVAEALGLVLAKLRPKQQLNASRQPLHIPTGQVPMKQDRESYSVGVLNTIESEKMPIDIMPLSIHNNDTSMNDMDGGMPYTQGYTDFTPSTTFDPSMSSSSGMTWSNATDPSPSSSWDLSDGPLPNILDGPEQINWVQFDQFLSSYGTQNEMEEDIL